MKEIFRRMRWSQGIKATRKRFPDLRLSEVTKMADVIGAPRGRFLAMMAQAVKGHETKQRTPPGNRDLRISEAAKWCNAKSGPALEKELAELAAMVAGPAPRRISGLSRRSPLPLSQVEPRLRGRPAGAKDGQPRRKARAGE